MVTTAYFIMGSIPLLTLKHDTPMDARFVRGFFNIYYIAAFVTATATALSFALAGRPWVAAGAAVLALLAVVLRRQLIPKMDLLGAQIGASDMDAIPGFRRTHAAAILINLAQLVAIVWCLIAVSAEHHVGAQVLPSAPSTPSANGRLTMPNNVDKVTKPAT
jgi:hypothetical protein